MPPLPKSVPDGAWGLIDVPQVDAPPHEFPTYDEAIWREYEAHNRTFCAMSDATRHLFVPRHCHRPNTQPPDAAHVALYVFLAALCALALAALFYPLGTRSAETFVVTDSLPTWARRRLRGPWRVAYYALAVLLAPFVYLASCFLLSCCCCCCCRGGRRRGEDKMARLGDYEEWTARVVRPARGRWARHFSSCPGAEQMGEFEAWSGRRRLTRRSTDRRSEAASDAAPSMATTGKAEGDDEGGGVPLRAGGEKLRDHRMFYYGRAGED